MPLTPSTRPAFHCLRLENPAFRGRGIGLATCQAGMTYLGERTAGLDCIEAQQNAYRCPIVTGSMRIRNHRHVKEISGREAFVGEQRAPALHARGGHTCQE